MSLPLLAAVLIVKDEAQMLPGCLDALGALHDLIGEVVVHDTGSTDDTVELARAAGATVHEGYWDGDFARARNVAIAATGAAWVLVVDADERVVVDDPERLREALESGLRAGTEIDACVVRLVNQAPDGGELYAAPQIRIFRPDRARYVGRLHESVEPKGTGETLRLLELPREVVAVRHLGYCDAEVVRAKALRNLQVLDKEVEALLHDAGADDGQLARALYHRGRTLLSAGRFAPALADLQRLQAVPPGPKERVWGGDVLAQLLLGLGRLDEARDLTEQLRVAGVDGGYCDWLTARALLSQERYAEALLLLRGIATLTDAVGRVLDVAPVVEAHMIAAGRVGEIDEAAACCIRLMAGFGRTQGLGSLLLTLWGTRPAEWLVELFRDADRGHLAAIADELAGCGEPGPTVAHVLRSSYRPRAPREAITCPPR